MKFNIKPLDTLLLEAYESKDKSIAKKILLELKKNPKQKMLYALIDNLKNGEVPFEDIDNFINENISMAKSIEINKLKQLFEDKQNIDSEPLSQAIGILLFENKTASNMSDYYKSFALVRENLKSNIKKDDLSAELSKFEVEYSQLEESDKIIVENFFKTPYSERQIIFENLTNECVTLLSESIQKTDNVDEKLKMYEVKDVIINYKFNDEDFITRLVNLHELKKDLI